MEEKKSKKVSLENKRMLFLEVGFCAALFVTLTAFQWGVKDAPMYSIAHDFDYVDIEEAIALPMDTPPEPPKAPELPDLSDVLEIMDDDIEIDDNLVLQLEDDPRLGVNIVDYIEEIEEEVVEDDVFDFYAVEEKPSFNGGDANDFSRWVNSNIVYPTVASDNGVQGRVVLQFTVGADGKVGNVKVVRSVDPSLDAEAVRVVSKSPKWTPGRQRDRAVRVTYTFPVIFRLQ